MAVTERALNENLAKVSSISFLPELLELVCIATGMGYAAVARVTEERWMAMAVRDEINFGLEAGGELPVASTICHEIRQSKLPVLIDCVANDAHYFNHHTPTTYGLQSYISFPIFLKDGTFFGTLCAIDPNPSVVETPAMRSLFSILSSLIGEALESIATLSADNLRKLELYATSEMKNLHNDIGAAKSSFGTQQAEQKMQMLKMKMDLLLMALDPQGSFLGRNRS